jgi:hypothetical protein
MEDMSDIDKTDLVEWIREGFSNEEILAYFHWLTIPRISAYRAHVTRGTYQEVYYDHDQFSSLASGPASVRSLHEDQQRKADIGTGDDGIRASPG